MDIYSSYRVPFNLAVWARGHKYHPVAVQITRDLKSIANLEAEMEAIERRKEEAEQALRTTLARAEQQLEGSTCGY